MEAYQNKIFELTLLYFIIAVLRSRELNKFFELSRPKNICDKKKQCQIKNFVPLGHPDLYLFVAAKLRVTTNMGSQQFEIVGVGQTEIRNSV